MSKYLVVKQGDINKTLTESRLNTLYNILDEITDYRKQEGKQPNNHYLVLNIDEPYAAEVYAIMHKHGHTPCADCHKCVSGSCPTYYKECPWFSLWASGIAHAPKAEGKPCGG
jgi:hypothetical protein